MQLTDWDGFRILLDNKMDQTKPLKPSKDIQIFTQIINSVTFIHKMNKHNTKKIYKRLKNHPIK